MIIMGKVFFFILLVGMANTQLSGQFITRATASTSTEIINPIGTEITGDMIFGSFNTNKKVASTVAVAHAGLLINGKVSRDYKEGQARLSSFQIVGGEYIYAITVAYDPVIINQAAVNETMIIESFNISPKIENNQEQLVLDKFSIGATLRVKPSQLPGFYTAPNPYAVTINFN